MNSWHMKPILEIFFPKVCAACDKVLLADEEVVCTTCLHKLPLIPNLADAEELIRKQFYGRLLVEHAASLLFYHKGGLSQHLIHQLKYRGVEEVSYFLGNWLGRLLKELKWAADINCVIPVPLHKKRRKKRGYNQVTGFAQQLAFHLNCHFSEKHLIKIVNSRTQVFKDRLARSELKGAYFTLVNATDLAHQHILLVDDLMTTGATLETCVEILQKAQPAKISLATMAITV